MPTTGLWMVDLLARLQLAARRSGAEIRFQHVTRELRELIDLAGLAEALPVEAGRQTEAWKKSRGVEEERELPDSPA